MWPTFFIALSIFLTLSINLGLCNSWEPKEMYKVKSTAQFYLHNTKQSIDCWLLLPYPQYFYLDGLFFLLSDEYKFGCRAANRFSCWQASFTPACWKPAQLWAETCFMLHWLKLYSSSFLKDFAFPNFSVNWKKAKLFESYKLGENSLKEMNYVVPRKLVYNSINFQIVSGILCAVIITWFY